MSPRITHYKAIIANSYFIFVHIYTNWTQRIRPTLTESMLIPYAHRVKQQRPQACIAKVTHIVQCLLVPFTSYNIKWLATRIFKINMNLKSLDSSCLLGPRQQEQREIQTIDIIISPALVTLLVVITIEHEPGHCLFNDVTVWKCLIVLAGKDCSNKQAMKLSGTVKSAICHLVVGAYHNQIHVLNVILDVNNGDLTHK